MKRYAWLLVVGVLASAAGLVAIRQLRASAPAAEAAAAPEMSKLALVVGADRLEPELASVPKGHLVTLEVRNERETTVTLLLQGYEDKLTAGPIAPGETWRGTFLADRPGEAFPWRVGDETVGRLAVMGSHLVEGHR